MLLGPWLLLRALLLLGAAPGAPAHQDWTLSASSMGPSAPPTEEAPSPPAPNRTSTAPENRHPPAPGTQYTPENRHPPAPGTQYTPENRHPPAPGTQYTPENRHPPAPGTQYPPGPSTYLPANPGARIPPEPGGPDTPSSSEPWRSGFWTEKEALPRTHIPPEPMRTESPEPARTGAELSTEPGGNETPSAPEKNTTEGQQGMEAGRDWVRTGTKPPSEPVRTGTNPPSEPVRTGTNPPSEPVRTGTNPPSEPVRTGTNPPSEPVSVVFRTHAATQTHVSTGSEPGGTLQDLLPAAGRTGSVTDVVQGPVMRRHMSKRMSHTDSYLSTTFPRGGDRTLLSVTNVSVFSDFTEIPSAYNVDSTPSRNRETVGATNEDLANRTEPGSGSTLKISGTSPWGSGSDSGISMPATDPLLTPSYRNPTDSSTVPFTSVPVTAPNITDGIQTTNSSLDLSSPFLSSSSSSSSSHSSSSTSLSVPISQSSLPFSVSSNESFLSPEAATFPNSFHTKSSKSEVFSSSPIPSTLVFSDRPPATASPSLSDVPPVSVFTRPYVPLTAASAEPVLPVSPITALPTSSPAAGTEATVPSVSSSQTAEPSTATNSSGTGLILHSVRPHVTDTAGFDGTDSRETSASFSVTVTLPVGTLKPEDKPPGTFSPVEKTRTPSAATAQFSQPPTLSTDSAPPTTLHGQFLPTFPYSTQQTPEPDKTARPGSSKTATGGPGVETTDGGTASVTPDTLTLGVDSQTSSTTRSHKQGVQTTLSASTVIPTSSATSIAKPPTTTLPSTTTTTASVCSSGPCQNGGRCTEDRLNKTFRCECPPAWHGVYCSRDVDECLSDPCPPRATCTNTRGSFSCRCPLGYNLEKGAGCILVRTFLGHVKMPRSFLNGSSGKYTALPQIEEEIVSVLSSSFSALDGFLRSVVTNSSQTNQITVSVQNVFSLASNVTAYDLTYSLQRYMRSCQSHPERHPGCHLLLHPQLYYIAGSLCAVNSPGCDRDTAECSDVTGVSVCQCKPGYFKFTVTDHSCRACEDGYKRENGTCVRCPFGLGGFNCSNPYQLITVIIASAGGGVLLILGIALAVMCCRKNKNDISKLIFKSGDFQMSPYAEYAKTPRSSDWGRETIEMQENGSTKNLLQMTDVYYSPGLRNPELERNGLYPYTGAPGSRHSCIYPGQFNPSFITEENRRRDYF